MKEKAEVVLADCKREYRNLFVDSRYDEIDEAEALGCDKTTAHNYLKLQIDRHLPVGLAANSLMGDGLATWLANKRGGAFVKICGQLDGCTHDEQCRIGHDYVELCHTDDSKRREELLRSIAMHAERALKEISA